MDPSHEVMILDLVCVLQVSSSGQFWSGESMMPVSNWIRYKMEQRRLVCRSNFSIVPTSGRICYKIEQQR